MYRYTLIINSEKIVVTNDKKKIHRLLKRAIEASISAVDSIIETAENAGKAIIFAEDESEFLICEEKYSLFAFEQ